MRFIYIFLWLFLCKNSKKDYNYNIAVFSTISWKDNIIFIFEAREGSDYFSIIKFYNLLHFPLSEIYLRIITKRETPRIYLIIYHIVYESIWNWMYKQNKLITRIVARMYVSISAAIQFY